MTKPLQRASTAGVSTVAVSTVGASTVAVERETGGMDDVKHCLESS